MTATVTRNMIPDQDRLIYALDGMSLEQAIRQVRALSDVIKIYKIGPALIYEGGMAVAAQIALAANGGNIRVFLDMKTADIPETMFSAIEAIERTDVQTVVFATIHAFGNLRKVAEAKDKAKYKFKIFAITLLTSMDDSDLRDVGIQFSVPEYVLAMAKRAKSFGFDGVISSGQEARSIRSECGDDFLIVTPGIRLAGSAVESDDQKRVVTPRQAILNGADYIVVGRPIRRAPDPLAAAKAIQHEIATAVADRERGATSRGPGSPQLMAAS
jgi:orotidine-5'-phosphate decarboxylase